MKVITIKQPFATLIAEGIKEYEFRVWKTKYRGEIWIHAGKGVDSKAMKKYAHLGLEYPSGCILARCLLTDCIPVDTTFRQQLQEKNSVVYASIIKHLEWQGYAFHLEKVTKVPLIPVAGKLSIWNYDGPCLNEKGEKNERC